MLDLIAVIAHHLLAFSIPAVLVAELVLLSEGLAGERLRRVARIDGLYGLLAMGLVVVGIVRVAYGARGADFYLANPVFWTKMAAFGAVGLLSIRPTIRMARWARQSRQDGRFTPPGTELGQIRRLIVLELLVFAIIPIAAAALGRGYGA